MSKRRFADLTKGAGTSSATDYVQLGYDANGNVVSSRRRDGTSIAFTYDKLDRITLKDLPGTEPDVSYGYDNLGRLTSASQTGNALSFTYDALSRKLTETSPRGTVSSEYDLAGRRTKLTYPGTGLFVNHDYLVTGEVSKIRENGAATGVGVLATYGYDNLGNRTSLTFGNGVVQNFTYDPVSRLASLTNDLSGTANDLSVSGIAYNPASLITALTRSNDAYAFTELTAGTTDTVSNGLNQLASIGGAATTWDARGNLTTDPTSGMTYGYSSEDLLTSATGGVTLAYDGLQRLYQVAEPAITRFAYDGLNEIAEYNASNVLQRRFVFEPGSGQPLVQYEEVGADSGRRFMSADERGSIIARTRSDGSLFALNRYDEYGKPQSSNSGRFGYTGQAWISQVGLNYFKTRMYAPHLGIFAQTDRIGLAGGPNLYNAMGGDPVNRTDPLGTEEQPIEVVGKRLPEPDFGSGFAGGGDPFGGSSTGGYSGGPPGAGGDDIIVEAPRLPAQECSEAQVTSCAPIEVNANPLPAAPTSLPPFVQAAAPSFPSLCERRDWHNLKLAEKVIALRAAGFEVATEVRIRLLGPNKQGYAVADYIATIPGSNVYRIGEVKTGGATLTKRQMQHYGLGIAQILSGNAGPVGLGLGEFIPVVWTGEDRFPGCRP